MEVFHERTSFEPACCRGPLPPFLAFSRDTGTDRSVRLRLVGRASEDRPKHFGRETLRMGHQPLQAFAAVWWQALLLTLLLSGLLAMVLYSRGWLLEKASAVRFLAA